MLAISYFDNDCFMRLGLASLLLKQISIVFFMFMRSLCPFFQQESMRIYTESNHWKRGREFGERRFVFATRDFGNDSLSKLCLGSLFFEYRPLRTSHCDYSKGFIHSKANTEKGEEGEDSGRQISSCRKQFWWNSFQHFHFVTTSCETKLIGR